MWKIAIIDDDRRVLTGMKAAIPWKELEAEWIGEALNGVDGLKMIEDAQPDIIITDIYMPVMNGLDMIEQLRQEQFSGKIIILSGYSDFEYARQALRLNVSDYVSKPVSIPTLKAILSKSIRELTEEEQNRVKQDELQQKLMLYEPFFEKEWVKAAVAGTLDSSYRQESVLPPSYRYWTGCRHVVIGIELLRDTRAGEFTLTDWSLFRFAISNIACEIAREAFPLIEYTELHSARTALVIHPHEGDGTELLLEKLRQLGMRLIDCVYNYLNLVVKVGIGHVKEHWREIPESTEEAFRAIELKDGRAAAGYGLYLYGSGARSSKERVVLPPVKLYLELAGAMKASQEKEAQQIVAGYLERLEQQADVSPEDIQVLAGEMWAIFAYCLYEVGMVLDDVFPSDRIAKEMAGLSKPSQLANWLTGKIAAICSSRLWRGNSKHRQAVEYMIQYIHEHYADDITLGDLSDKVYISRNYLSIIFKNMTGETVNNYVTRVRIEKARELLLERNMLVYEVAEKVGFRNVPYFSTLFKKYTGMNPTELVK